MPGPTLLHRFRARVPARATLCALVALLATWSLALPSAAELTPGPDARAQAAASLEATPEDPPAPVLPEEIIIGNGQIERHLAIQAGTLHTTALADNTTGHLYPLAPRAEFTLALRAGDQRLSLSSDAFQVTGVEQRYPSAKEQQLRLAMSAPFQSGQVEVSLVYEAVAGQDFMRKWLEVTTTGLQGWSLRGVTLEDLALQPHLQPLAPFPRYQGNLGSKPRLDQTEARTSFPPEARYLGYNEELGEGMFFFTEHLFGQEKFSAADGLLLSHAEAAPLEAPYVSGRAVIGTWQGAAVLGFKRFTTYLQDHYSLIKHKPIPIYYSTWYNYRDGIDANRVDAVLDTLSQRHGYEALYLDAGWEGDELLTPSRDRFPHGLSPLAERAARAGLKLGLWVSPFGWSEKNFATHLAHPEWQVAAKEFISLGRRLGPFCPNTGVYDYVHDHLEQLARQYDLAVLYWDSADWNLPPCPASPSDTRDDDELRLAANQRLAALLQDLHQIRPDLISVVWSEPVDPHRLAFTDQNQFTDVWGLPIIYSEIMRRQQAYQVSFEYPYHAIWNDWYGVDYVANHFNNYALPLSTLEYAEMSMIGNGLYSPGASLDFARAPAELVDFVERLLVWRKPYQSYFTVYQHVLGFPDGNHVDGEAHLIDGRGFIILNNPSRTPRTVRLPLDDPELELDPGTAYPIDDWSHLDSAVHLGDFRPNQAPTIAMPPLTVKILGVGAP